jgi:hypothetical protein
MAQGIGALQEFDHSQQVRRGPHQVYSGLGLGKGASLALTQQLHTQSPPVHCGTGTAAATSLYISARGVIPRSLTRKESLSSVT